MNAKIKCPHCNKAAVVEVKDLSGGGAPDTLIVKPEKDSNEFTAYELMDDKEE